MKLYSANFKGVSFFSRLTKLQTGGDYSHTAIWLDDKAKEYIKELIGAEKYSKLDIDTKCFIEQWPHGDSFLDAWFDFSDLSTHTPGTEFEIWSLDLPEDEWKYCINYYFQHLKEEYDWKGIVHFRFKSVKEDPDKSFCSEIAFQPLSEVKNCPYIKPFNVHPSLFVGLIHLAGGKLEEIRTV